MKTKILFTVILLPTLLLMIGSCNTDDSDSDKPSAAGCGTVNIKFDLVNSSSTGDRGHWGIHAWIMKENTYVDTLEYYKNYDRYIDAGNASKVWLDDGGKSVDGISSATVYTDSQSGYTSHYTLNWDVKDYNGTKVPEGMYTLKVVVSRHTRLMPYGTLYVAAIQIGKNSSQSVLTLNATEVDPDTFPYNVLENGVVEYKIE